MKKEYYVLKKDYPELGFKLEINDHEIIWSGKKIPDSLRDPTGRSTYFFQDQRNNIKLMILSDGTPAMNTDSKILWLFTGGRNLNRDFTITESLYFNKYLNKFIEIFPEVFTLKVNQLNKHVKVL